ncbi:MAG TPA: cysteine hydrolase family protein [Solirubrobacteraceae bacterium]|jgi:nicotinamidase-related amidase|nr:cysteine hydrolase family protein [Solirubrobacteraceae bacterium]
MARALLLIDIQRDYFPGGAYPLVGSDSAADAAAEVLERFRRDEAPVIHVRHVWDAPDAEFMRPGTPGVDHDARVAPRAGETVVVKEEPNAFLGTDLEQRLRAQSIDELVVAGMMTSMCVDATVRAAADLGFEVTVVGDGCAAPNLAHDGIEVAGEHVHAAFLAALADGYATVVKADSLA